MGVGRLVHRWEAEWAVREDAYAGWAVEAGFEGLARGCETLCEGAYAGFTEEAGFNCLAEGCKTEWAV